VRSLSSNEIRAEFNDYFGKHGFHAKPSASLVPHGDKSLLFTNAGMVPWKNHFIQPGTAPEKRLTSIQKCVRAGGKHNDLENVGFTPRHHTFFEMLGFFSFGDLSKLEATQLAWKFLTKELALPEDRLSVTVFKDDDESYEIWRRAVGLAADRISRKGSADNFWAMGDEGPCGPCTEIFWDTRQGNTFDERFLEIWNVVFMQFNRNRSGVLDPLPTLCIDTGMGLERLACVLQGKQTNFDTDLFAPIYSRLDALITAQHANNASTNDHQMTVYRNIIADHVRSSAFLVADGVTPSNIGRGYVLRRIIRRAVRAGEQLGLHEPFLHHLLPGVTHAYGNVYGELGARSSVIADVLREEEHVFRKTLDKGNRLLAHSFASPELQRTKVIPGSVAFQLHATHGFPLDLTVQIARERGWTVDRQGSDIGLVDVNFVGYDQNALSIKATVAAAASSIDETTICIDPCPFYGFGGGQAADQGKIWRSNGETWDVIDVTLLDSGAPALRIKRSPGSTADASISHGTLQAGELVQVQVDLSRRLGCEVHHTATHLLNAALKHVLCKEVMQAGSFVGPDRLRFDFTHGAALTAEQLQAVEAFVNNACLADKAISAKEKSLQEALETGAVATFSEKYGSRVRVVEVPGVSAELCAGTHVRSTLEVFPFRITSDSSVAAGTRRIEAVAGIAGTKLLMEHSKQAALASVALGAMLNEQEKQRSSIRQLHTQLAQSALDVAQSIRHTAHGTPTLLTWPDAHARMLTRIYAGVRICAHILPQDFPQEAAQKRLTQYQKAEPDTVHLLVLANTVMVALNSKQHPSLNAGQLIRSMLAELGGKGGGKRDFAQG
ncbi:tRNA synthetases class II (A)-domain-containing protein, partial [Thamnocephalis sphaerospora]